MNIGTGGQEMAITAAIAEEAGRWDARLRAPDCADADRARFAVWRDADPAHRAAFERLQTIVATFRHDRSRADVRALRDEALRVAATYQRRRFGWMASAASLVALTVGIVVWKAHTGDWMPAPLSDLVARLTGTEIYATGTGERSTFVLADGSSVELNARSRINVDYSEFERNVELVRGQALFSVAKNTRRPFVVHAADRDIVAVGTQFDVRLEADSVQVTLLEGKVRVEQGRPAQGGPEQSRAEQEVMLTPGKQLVAKLARPTPARAAKISNKEDVVRSIDVAKVTGWRDGRVFLEDLPLQDAVREMNRHSAVQIVIDDPVLAQHRVNGMFKAGEQEAFVTALEEYFPVSVRRAEQEIILSAR